MKIILLIATMICFKTTIAQHTKPVINIYFDSASKSNILEYHSAPINVLLDTIAQRKGHKISFHETNPTEPVCGQISLEKPIMVMLYEVSYKEYYYGYDHLVFLTEGKNITASPYAQYTINTTASGETPKMDKYYNLLRKSMVLKFVNVPPVTVMDELAKFNKYKITYKVDTTSGQTVTGLIPLEMDMNSFIILFCQKHGICHSETGKRKTELCQCSPTNKKTL